MDIQSVNRKFPYFLVGVTAIAGTIIATVGGIVIVTTARLSMDSQTRLIIINAGASFVTVGSSIVVTGVAAAGTAYQTDVKEGSSVTVDSGDTRTQVSAGLTDSMTQQLASNKPSEVDHNDKP